MAIVLFSSAASAANIYVNGTSGSDSNSSTSWQHAKQTIGNATETVTAGGTVHIANGIYKGTNNTNITITKNMNIIGESQNGTIIDGNKEAQIFHINSGLTVTLEKLTLTQGIAEFGGGAIDNLGTLTINSLNIKNNAQYDYGGQAVANWFSGTMIINNSNFQGPVRAIENNRGIMTINNSNLNNNTAQGVGGAIFNYLGTMTITNCNNNKAITNGGAIFNYLGNLTVSNTPFTGNRAIAAGAIFNDEGSNLIVTSTNSNQNIAYYGGAIYNNEKGNLTVTNSTFTGNKATYYGGAIYNFGYDEGRSTVTDSIFTSNNATDYGGAIYNYSTLIVTDSIFNRNGATNGGAIYNDGNNTGTLSITSSTFNQNNATNGGAIINLGNLAINFTGSWETSHRMAVLSTPVTAR